MRARVCVRLGVPPPPDKVGEVMRREMERLNKCFDRALARYGGVAALPEVDPLVAAKAMDDALPK